MRGQGAGVLGSLAQGQPAVVARGDVGAGEGTSVCSFSGFMHHIGSAARGFLEPFKLGTGPESWARVNIVT